MAPPPAHQTPQATPTPPDAADIVLPPSPAPPTPLPKSPPARQHHRQRPRPKPRRQLPRHRRPRTHTRSRRPHIRHMHNHRIPTRPPLRLINLRNRRPTPRIRPQPINRLRRKRHQLPRAQEFNCRLNPPIRQFNMGLYHSRSPKNTQLFENRQRVRQHRRPQPLAPNIKP